MILSPSPLENNNLRPLILSYLNCIERTRYRSVCRAWKTDLEKLGPDFSLDKIEQVEEYISKYFLCSKTPFLINPPSNINPCGLFVLNLSRQNNPDNPITMQVQFMVPGESLYGRPKPQVHPEMLQLPMSVKIYQACCLWIEVLNTQYDAIVNPEDRKFARDIYLSLPSVARRLELSCQSMESLQRLHQSLCKYKKSNSIERLKKDVENVFSIKKTMISLKTPFQKLDYIEDRMAYIHSVCLLPKHELLKAIQNKPTEELCAMKEFMAEYSHSFDMQVREYLAIEINDRMSSDKSNVNIKKRKVL